MSKIIIGIHGLGNKPPRKLFHRWWENAIKEGLNAIGRPRFFLKCNMVYWAHILHPIPLNPNERNEKSEYFLKEPYSAAKNTDAKKPSKLRQKVLDYLEKQVDNIFLNNDLTLNFSSVNDLVIHHFFRDLEIYYSETCLDENKSECYAKEIIRNQLLQTLRKYRNKKIMLIAHSMGSIIAYDVLLHHTSDIKIDTFITIGSPLGLPVIISKVVSEQERRLRKVQKVKTPENVIRAWYNFSDLEDKVALDYNLANDYESNSQGIHVVDYIVSNDYEVNGHHNPHKAYGYLRTPELAQVVDDFLNRGSSKLIVGLQRKINSYITKALKPQ